MRTFVIRARKASIRPDKVFAQVGSDEHFEIIAHTLANAFYYSNGMRENVQVYVVLDSSPDFPRTLKFSSNEGLSFPGFHERAILEVIVSALTRGAKVTKDSVLPIQPGIEICGFGFDTLMKGLQEKAPTYLLDSKGEDVRNVEFQENALFVLSDHLSMPKNSIKGLERRGLTKISLGKRVLFASQCVVLVHNEMDRQGR
ncbi:MAG: tRNA (pseudouridine(54)-N(1))-methyltransferase TrmY [Deltaproteobacteria bacterium]|nr:tRNA (pseudouridine(54)-N(1))-methyltransferase TrmY [Deltaproteobacteria bacterium]